MKHTDVAILGAGGYTGKELLCLLKRHPYLQATHITSDRHAGRNLGVIFPDLGESKLVFKKHNEPLPKNIPVFLATPNDISLKKVPYLINEGHRLVDLSGAFRLHDKEIWEQVYGLEHTAFEQMKDICYGLPELFREKISKAKAIANPGCYPTSVIFPLIALGILRKRLVSIAIQSCSGVSGAGGRVEGGGFPFAQVYENFRAYKILSHQHEAEMQEYAMHGLQLDKEEVCPLTFTPHLLPIHRGILSTIVLHWDNPAPEKDELKSLLSKLANNESFLRFYANPEDVQLTNVQYTNYLDIGIRSRDRVTIIVSAIDNLIKGAAGQAIQNMNLLLQLPETAGLL